MTLEQAIDEVVKDVLQQGVPPAMLAGALFGAGVALMRALDEPDPNILGLVSKVMESPDGYVKE